MATTRRNRAGKAANGQLVMDMQGPFSPHCQLIKMGQPFVSVDLFSTPEVSIYVSSRADAEMFIRIFTQARDMLPETSDD